MYLGLVSFLQLAKQSLPSTQTPTPFYSKTLSPSEALHRLVDLPFCRKQIPFKLAYPRCSFQGQ